MTTLVGIKANRGKKGVVLASDLNKTRQEWKPEGDIAYKELTTSETQKIYAGHSNRVAIAGAGIVDSYLGKFIEDIKRGKIDIEKVITESYFPEVLDMNLNRWNGTVPIAENSSSFLMATRFGEPKLYTCWPLGKVEERLWTSIGSGSKYALQYLRDAEGPMQNNSWTLKRSLDLSVESLNRASQDIYTGGLDIVVLTKEGLFPFGKDIKTSLQGAKKRVVRNIKSKL